MKRIFTHKLSIFFLFFIFCSVAYGQVYKLKATSFSSKYEINDYSWSDWSELTDSDVLITLDITNDRITIYSSDTQIYDIAEYEGQTTDEEGDDFYNYYCVNEDGLTCRVRLAILNSQEGRNQIYVVFADMIWVYNVYSLD